MKKIFTCIVAGILFISANCQEQPDGVMEMVLPSPEAFQMTKYGDVPVNESSGRIAPSIPLYNYLAGRLQLPITLSYVGNGVKVDQLSGRTGINWNLEVGGVITRIVRDLPDEMVSPDKRLRLTKEALDSMSFIEGSDDVIFLNSVETSKTYDTQADIFNFSIPGYSGSFYLNENLEPVLASYDREFKIILTSYNAEDGITEFLIISPDGLQYNFGGNNATERTRSNPGIPDVQITANTAFYLYEIRHPLGDEIIFTYQSEENPYYVDLSQTQHISHILYSIGYCIPPEDHDPISSVIQRMQVFNGKYLYSISSNRTNTAIFFSDTILSPGYEYRRMLSKLSVIGQGDDGRLNVDFSYIADTERFFLEQVSITNPLDSTDSNPEIYRMEYNDPLALPARLSYRQDHLGYFNNKNNVTLIPQDTGVFGFLNYTLADREPVFAYASKGALSGIHYPSGGYTLFEYEAPPVRQLSINRAVMQVYCSFPGLIPDTDLTDTYLISIPFEQNDTIPGQTIDVHINVSADENVNHHYVVKISLLDLETDSIESRQFPLAPDITNYNRVFSFSLEEGHFYRAYLELEPNPDSPSDPYRVLVNAYFDYASGYGNEDGLGLRIKRVTDYPDDSTAPLIKRYYYKAARDLDSEFEYNLQVDSPNYYYYTTNTGTCPNEPNYLAYFAHMQSSTVNFIFPLSDNVWLYPNVTISFGGDNFENGGIQKSFDMIKPRYPETYLSSMQECFLDVYKTQRENTDIYNSDVARELTLIKGYDGILYQLQETQYSYSKDSTIFTTNMIIKRPYYYVSWIPNYTNVDGLYIGLYNTYSLKNYPISTIVRNFVDPAPVTDNNPGSYRQVVNTKLFQYTAYVGLPTKIISNSSEDNKYNITKCFYVNQLLGLSDLDIEESVVLNSLRLENRLSEAVQVDSYISSSPTQEGVLLSRLRKHFGGSLYLPQRIRSSTGSNPLEDYFSYEYDNYGNITEVHKRDTINEEKTFYVWGYNKTVPIVKVERYQPSDLVAIQPLLDSAMNASDNDINQYNEDLLINLQDSIRKSLSNSFVLTYTYDLPYGLSSMTDPNGKTTYYGYDSFGRLTSVLDNDHNLVKEYSYHIQEEFNDEVLGTYSITAGKTGDGTITPAGNTEVVYGSDLTYAFTPDTGWSIADVLVDGVSVGAVTSYTFNGLISNHIISVVFDCPEFLNLSTDHLYFNLSKGSASFTISSNVNWNILKDVGWLSIVPSTGSDTASIFVRCASLSSGTRTGTITVTGGGITKTITVFQGAYLED